MIELHYWPTGNGTKVRIFLEEAGLAYTVHPVNINAGQQFKSEFLAISPNNRIPAILDRAPADGGEPISLFESGAILAYLAEKTGKFMPGDVRGRARVLEWVFWQVGGLGPMAGQKNHFQNSAPEKLPYAIDRYVKETNRLYGVLDRRLAGRDYIAGAYSIADMACYPWMLSGKRHGDDLGAFANVRSWMDRMAARPAVAAAYAMGEDVRKRFTSPDEDRAKFMFGQTAASVAKLSGT